MPAGMERNTVTYHQSVYQKISIICPAPCDQSFQVAPLLTVSPLFPKFNRTELNFAPQIQYELNKVGHIYMRRI